MYAAGGPAAPVSSGDEEAVIHRGYVALTFDDGPHPKYTEQLLDGLKERGVVATFFVTGENAENYPGHYPERTGRRTSDREPYL